MKRIVQPVRLIPLGTICGQTRGELQITQYRDSIAFYYEMHGIAND